MNVLVYSGPGVSETSLYCTISTLKDILGTSFAIQTVSPKVLETEPWAPTCALLVIPGGRDLPYLSALGPAMKTIATYVRKGGSYLGICAGAYFASGRIEWEMGTPLEVQGERPLKFFPGLSRGCMYPGFQYESENGARTVSVRMSDGRIRNGLYYNGGGEFILSNDTPNVTPLAFYDDSEKPNTVAAVSCRVEEGNAVLWHVHLEYPTTSELVKSAAARVFQTLSESDVTKVESERKEIMLESLRILRLKTSNPPEIPTNPLPQYICATEASKGMLEEIHTTLNTLIDQNLGLIDDSTDQFLLHDGATSSISQNNDDRRHLVFCKDGLPSPEVTPHFSISAYFSHLTQARKQYSSSPRSPLQCNIGEVLQYGEAVTSTQTLLERNIKTLEVLPAPILSLATYQLNGRGRGGNVWVSPLGCLQWSLLLRPPPQFPNSKLVFIQYLVGLAVVEACREVLGSIGERVVLKWPNDIYAKARGEKGEELRKIGGILVNTVFMAGGVRIIVGCGLNVLNEPPIFSISQLDPSLRASNQRLTMENMLAAIMVKFGRMWDEFVSEGSFEPFIDLYLDRWIHSDQLVTLDTVKPPLRVRIAGITPEHGLLRTVPEKYQPGGPQFIDLQPDGNSFDMMAGLIKTKQ
ncbi:related to BPL1-biotin holocarboxylase synthetase [Serendipita indica DSM 11827]|uniref:Related to BPL1-biotin holocarboxylase synthetase n=1 Tax=Serendipita indica (strain DSM 11827) TaxID=1109443 RepID=G4THZ1_SERID|nr:related to BPL1-biotin holocarboxylase synthetase [Serendipita indica DSM 11827]